MTLTIQTIPARGRPDAASSWRELEARVPAPALATSWDWTETWLDHYGDGVPHRFALATRDGRPVGIALVTEGRRRRLRRRRTIHLGTAGEPAEDSVYVERNGLLAEPGLELEFATALIAELRERHRGAELRLDGFRAEDARVLLGSASGAVARHERSPYTDLDGIGDLDGVLARLRSGVRRRIRQSLRAFGEVELELAATPDEAVAILDELAELNRRRWEGAGKRSAFASARFTQFHRALVARLAPERALLFRARAGERTIGCVYGLVDGEDLLFYQGGFARFDDNRLRAGLVTHALCMAECAARGLRRYDMLAGESRYKDELSTASRDLIWARAELKRAPAAERPRGVEIAAGSASAAG